MSLVAARLLILSIPLLVAGCRTQGDSEVTVVTVSGNVNVDGAPLELGSIEFINSDGNSGRAAAEIKDGAYRVQLTPGPKRVEIRGFKVLSETVNATTGQTEKVTEQTLPAKFNTGSDLSTHVTEKESMEKNDFDLKTK